MLNFDWASDIPQETAKMIFFGLYLVIGAFVMLLPNEYIYEGVPKEERFWYNNLKIWSAVVLGILATVYYLF
ncbi:hypothetical protein D1013_15200 [Euzebyella marina]|uniref:Uncharacterized protein n=1 Tax=Euzebyella marina TaxID=1761453 RepID=A0A3G2L8M2_9FLAO|nr:hypothetical protein [Euzebyella marina]AYN68628.1 hypothetical protein D1013_15200 [Euzebyella marina]